MGSAIVTDMVATCGAAAKQLFTMRFRRRRLRRYVAAMACGDLCHVALRYAAMWAVGTAGAIARRFAYATCTVAAEMQRDAENESQSASGPPSG